jgi:hypothetical protein
MLNKFVPTFSFHMCNKFYSCVISFIIRLYSISVIVIQTFDMTCVEHQNRQSDCQPLGSDDPRPRLFTMAMRIVRACAESVRVSGFLAGFVSKTYGINSRTDL